MSLKPLATSSSVRSLLTSVRWVSPGYDMNTEGEYVFTPEIESYTVSAPLPEIVVTVGEMPPIAAARGLVTPMSTTTYGIWVGGVEVTSANKDSITGTGITGNVTYNPDTKTLTLNFHSDPQVIR